MDNQKEKYLILENDIVEILHNANLKNKPYLIRLVNFSNENYEIRVDRADIKFLVNFLQDYMEGI